MKRKYPPNGFTLIDSLLGLCVSMIVAFLALLLILTCHRLVNLPSVQQDQFAILQMRQLAMLASDNHTKNGYWICTLNHEEYMIGYDRHRLVKEKGYEILMEFVDQAEFYEKEHKIFLKYEKNKKTYTFQII